MVHRFDRNSPETINPSFRFQTVFPIGMADQAIHHGSITHGSEAGPYDLERDSIKKSFKGSWEGGIRVGRKWLEEKYLLILINGICLGFPHDEYKVEEDFSFCWGWNSPPHPQIFQLIHFTRQIKAHLLSQEMSFCIIISGILLILP